MMKEEAMDEKRFASTRLRWDAGTRDQGSATYGRYGLQHGVDSVPWHRVLFEEPANKAILRSATRAKRKTTPCSSTTPCMPVRYQNLSSIQRSTGMATTDTHVRDTLGECGIF